MGYPCQCCSVQTVIPCLCPAQVQVCKSECPVNPCCTPAPVCKPCCVPTCPAPCSEEQMVVEVISGPEE